MRPAIAAYLSGHGFGHFTRSAGVLERLAAGGCDVHIRTGALTLPLARQATWAASAEEAESGPMVIQRGPLASDLPATLEALERHLAHFERTVESEACWIRARDIALVYADHPPLAVAAAAAAGVPSLSLGNFSWSWIFAGFVEREPRFAPLAERLARIEAQVGLHLALPFSGGLDHLPRREEVPLVVRSLTRTRAAARALLPVPPGEKRPVVLVSFGGFPDELDMGEAARRNPRFFFVAFSPPRAPVENLATLPHYHGLPHQDLVLGADALLSKPGYGTVSEAIAARRPLIFAPRQDFREAQVLLPAIERELAHATLSREELFEGRWTPALDRALAMECPASSLRTDGAEAAAQRILALV